jgi:magnesium chelatase family protein
LHDEPAVAKTRADGCVADGSVTRSTLRARAFDRVVPVARTIADLAAAEHIACEHAAEALLYRGATR